MGVEIVARMNIETERALLATKSYSEFYEVARKCGGPFSLPEMTEKCIRHFGALGSKCNSSTEEEDPGGFSDPIVETDENGDMWYIYPNRRERAKPNG